MSEESGHENPELSGVVIPRGAKETPEAGLPAHSARSSEVAETAQRMMTVKEAREAIDEMLKVQDASITSEGSFTAAFGKLVPALMTFGPHIINNTEAATGNSRSIRPEIKKAAWEDAYGAEQLVVHWPLESLRGGYQSPAPADDEIDDLLSMTPPKKVDVYTNRSGDGKEQADFSLLMIDSGVMEPHLQVGYTPAKGERVAVEIKPGEQRQSHEYSLAAKGTLHALRVLRSRDAVIMREKPALPPSPPSAIEGPGK